MDKVRSQAPLIKEAPRADREALAARLREYGLKVDVGAFWAENSVSAIFLCVGKPDADPAAIRRALGLTIARLLTVRFVTLHLLTLGRCAVVGANARPSARPLHGPGEFMIASGFPSPWKADPS